jgi:co-chaperonin GroES (HSP10)
MQAIGKRIVISPVKETIKTESGILLSSADAEKIRYKKCLILSVGNECASCIKEGDVGYYDSSAGHTMALDSEIVTVITERDLVFVL